jgi:1-acyl-sn-glycerol-3-phosphate acyltransferase
MIDTRLDIRGNANVESMGRPVIYISNHPSLLDIPALFRAINTNTRMLYSSDVLTLPLPGFRWILMTFNHLPIDDKPGEQLEKDLERVNQAMAKGGYYWAALKKGAESKRLAQYKKSLFHMAKEHQALVIPLCIKGSDDIITQGKGWLNVQINRGLSIECMVLPTIDANHYEDAKGVWDACDMAIKKALE